MGRAKLIGPAKLWWKLNCQSKGVSKTSLYWSELKLRLKERYYPLNFETLKMNEFLACSWRGRAMDLYYEEFVRLSCYAPLIIEEQKLSRFILGMGDDLANEIDALWLATLADALIRAKAKMSSKNKSRTSANKWPVRNYYNSKNKNVRPHLNGATQN